MPLALDEHTSDGDLWQLVKQGNIPAFETLVRRHQSLVCAVAYNACGNLATSEDVAQETFWTAWRQRAGLREPGRLRAWLCGIARTLGNNARRRAARPAEAAGPLDEALGLSTAAPGPTEQAVSHEEETLVWRALDQIPEAYREPLILFYREGQAVAEVAEALDVSPDAVKQRLARGRAMLRDQVAELVESAMRRSRPGQSFAVGVLSGLATVAAKGAGAALPGMAGVFLTSGFLSGILGSLGGLAGGWLGTWLPAQLAPTKGEREFLSRSGRRMLLVAALFLAVLIGGIWAFIGPAFESFDAVGYLIFWAVWMAVFGIYVTVETVRTGRTMRRLRAAGGEPNDAPLRRRLEAVASRYRGRIFRSRATLFGLPLIDINVSDPMPRGERRVGVARGWIAIGDDARGILLAVGAKASGLIALGGLAVGGLSFGGVAVGVVAVGGLSAGVLGIGGLGMGIVALGGFAVGWQAAGGMAVAWDVAVGGGAAAWHAAYGGAAIAHDLAVGGGAWAAHANDDAARAVLLDHPLARGVQWLNENMTWFVIGLVLLSVLPTVAMMPLLFRREKEWPPAPPRCDEQQP
jgi:RNA polymerase sigma factor (sigma-70 family)